jgi:hypothetical protein
VYGVRVCVYSCRVCEVQDAERESETGGRVGRRERGFAKHLLLFVRSVSPIAVYASCRARSRRVVTSSVPCFSLVLVLNWFSLVLLCLPRAAHAAGESSPRPYPALV